MSSFSTPSEVQAYGSHGPSEPLGPLTITRRACSDNDVVIGVKFAGICHSDIHTIRGEWGPIQYPSVVGHEIGGHVLSVGKNVTKFKVGDVVGVGCMVDSCRSCESCHAGDEQYCTSGMVGTYNSKFKYAHCVECTPEGGNRTFGGYSKMIVVDHNFVLSIPTNLDLAAATPLLCAGVTMYSPMMHHGLRPNMRFGVAGLGGLGHMGVKLALAFGCHVTVISRGLAKKDDALANLKAHAYLDSSNAEEMAAASGTFDFIIDTIAAAHDLGLYINLLGQEGKLVMVGASPQPMPVGAFPFIMKRRTLTGSLIGGIKETQEMLDFCGRHNIVCDIEPISAAQINDAYERAIKSDVKYRFVIDVATI